MPTIALQAHFDGERSVLDEKFDLPVNTPLVVTRLPSSVQTEQDFEEVWLRATAASNAFAFLSDPAENVYTCADGEPLRHVL